MRVTKIGLDIAKQIFQVHGADTEGRAVLRRRFRRNQVAGFLRTCRPVSSGWKPVAVRTIGHA
jgi:transposase